VGLREEKKRRQREAIVEAASDLFRDRGYDRTRVQDIIDRAAISEATFFNYFPTKDALLHELADASVKLYTAMLDYELEQDHQPITLRLRELMRALALAAVHDPKLQALLYTRSDLFRASGALKQSELRLYDRLAEVFRLGQRRGEIRGDTDPLQLAETLTGIQHLVITNWLTGWWGKRDDLPARLDRATEIFLDGCRPAISAPHRKGRTRMPRARGRGTR
jgi:AcrR family transcriptional regulator